MILAELRGKLSSRLERSEDVLTSNVFSFFKYADRNIFLKAFLEMVDIDTSWINLVDTEFRFWPRYADNTEPDLVIIVGNHYLLIEAKYLSSFEWTENKELSQLNREIKGGLFESEALDKEFHLVAITAEYLYRPENFEGITKEIPHHAIKWVNWQSIHDLLLNILATRKLSRTNREFCQDLCDLFNKKNLRYFRDFKSVLDIEPIIYPIDRVFLASETTALRGDFIGFLVTLSQLGELSAVPRDIFHKSHILFYSFQDTQKMEPTKAQIYFKR